MDWHGSEKELVKLCKKGDLNAQAALYRRYAPAMYALCRLYLSDPQDAEDVLHDAFLKVFRNIRQFRGEGSLSAWIRQIVLHTIIDFLRKKRILAQLTEEQCAFCLEGIPSPDPSLYSQIYARELSEMIQQLPEGARIAFLLHAVEGYSHQEIANALGISTGTSKSQVARARQLLQEMLQKAQTTPKQQ